MSMRIDNSPRPPVRAQDDQLNLVQAHRGISEARSSIAALAVDPASSGYCNTFVNVLLYVPRAIGNFFYHRYVDVRMFMKAFFSMGGGTTSQEIERRQNELRTFQNVAQEAQCATLAPRRVVQNAFNRLSYGAQSLFYTVDWNYVNSLCDREITIEQAEEIQSEIVRETEAAISFQNRLAQVNLFYTVFAGLSSGDHSGMIDSISHAISGRADGSRLEEEPVADEPAPRRAGRDLDDPLAWMRPLDDLVDEPIVRPRARPAVPAPAARPRPGEIVFANTVPYDNHNIPADVQRKANEINRLKAGLNIPPGDAVPAGAIRWNIPDNEILPVFQCPISQELMSIPVFDKSHPAITAANVGNRDLRHILDKESLEGMFASGRSVRCPSCRHDTQRRNLLIDTELQDTILAFLSERAPANVRAGAPAEIVAFLRARAPAAP